MSELTGSWKNVVNREEKIHHCTILGAPSCLPVWTGAARFGAGAGFPGAATSQSGTGESRDLLAGEMLALQGCMDPGAMGDAALAGPVFAGDALAASVGGPVRGPSVRVCFLPPRRGSNAKHPLGLRR